MILLSSGIRSLKACRHLKLTPSLLRTLLWVLQSTPPFLGGLSPKMFLMFLNLSPPTGSSAPPLASTLHFQLLSPEVASLCKRLDLILREGSPLLALSFLPVQLGRNAHTFFLFESQHVQTIPLSTPPQLSCPCSWSVAVFALQVVQACQCLPTDNLRMLKGHASSSLVCPMIEGARAMST